MSAYSKEDSFERFLAPAKSRDRRDDDVDVRVIQLLGFFLNATSLRPRLSSRNPRELLFENSF